MRKRDHGFTLVEMIIAISILGIIVAAAVPSFRTINANGTARSVVALFEMDLTYARSHAVTKGDTVSLRERNNDISNGWEIVSQSTGDVLKQRGALDTGVAITSPDNLNRVTFSPTGSITTPGIINIRTSGCTGSRDASFQLMISGQIIRTAVDCQ